MTTMPPRSAAELAALRNIVGPVTAVVIWPKALTYVGGGLVIGGTVHVLPRVYTRVLDDLLGQLKQDDWQQWWRAAGLPNCELHAWVGGPRTEVRVRRSAKKVHASMDRAIPADHPTRYTDPGADAARADVDAVVGRLRERFDLAEPPAFT